MRKLLTLTAVLSAAFVADGFAQAPLPGPFQAMAQPMVQPAPQTPVYGSTQNATMPQPNNTQQPYWSQAPVQQMPYWMQNQQQPYAGNTFANSNTGNGNMNSQANGQAQGGMNFNAQSQGQNGFNQGFGNSAAPGYFPGFAAVSNAPVNNAQSPNGQYAPQGTFNQGNMPRSNQMNPYQNGQNWNGNGPWNQNWGGNQNWNGNSWGMPSFGWNPNNWNNFGQGNNQQGYGPSVGR